MNPKTTPPTLDMLLIDALASATPAETPSVETATRIREQLFQRVHGPGPDFLFLHSHEGEWIKVLKGVELKVLRHDAESRSYLLRMAPGAKLPPHEHALDEESLILEGDATINGVLCRSGDYHFAPRGKPHGWMTSQNGCMLFVRGAAG